MSHHRLLVLFSFVAMGCGGSGAASFTSLKGSFSRIESALEDIHTNVFSENFSGDLGDDQLGFAVESFTKAAAGTGLAADAEEISKKLTALGELAATHPPMDKLRAAVQDLESTVQAVKSKL